jgi:hypothetical protein
MSRVLPVLLLVVSACGGAPPDFSGRWSGNALQSAICDDGTSIPRVVPITLDARQDDNGVDFVTNTSCGTLRGEFDGDILRLQPAACAPLVYGVFTYADTILTGTVVRQDDTLRVSATVSTVLFSSTGAGRCSGPMSGTLERDDSA